MNRILPELLVYVWKVSDSTLFGCCNPFRSNVGEGAQNLKNLHRSYLGAELNSFLACQTENISRSFAAPRKTKRSGNACDPTGVAGRLAARGLFAARRVYIGRNIDKRIRSVGWRNTFRFHRPASESTSPVFFCAVEVGRARRLNWHAIARPGWRAMTVESWW